MHPLLPFLLLPLLFILAVAMHHNPRRNRRRPPGPKGLPFIGNLHQLDVSKPHIWLANHSNKYGPVTLFKLCRLPVIVLSSARVAKAAMKENDVAFAGRPHSSAWFRLSYDQKDIIGSAHTDYWRQMRKLVVHNLLCLQKIRSFRNIREEEVSRMISGVSKKAGSDQLVDVGVMAMSYTCNLLCRVAFGKRFDEGTESWRLFDGMIKQFLASVTETFVIDNLLFGWVNRVCGGARRVDKVFEEMDVFYQQLIDEHLSRRKKMESMESMDKNILDLLIEFKEDESAPVKIDWKHIKALLMNIFLGGTDSTGVTITWALTALMKNPGAMKKVQDEIRSVVGIKSSVSEDDIEKLPYLNAVIKETLRLYPPIPLVPKETTTSSVINGYEIEPKTLIFVNIWAIGKDPEYWENPEEFLPERFINTNIDYKGNDFGFISFGSGRRICPGMNLASATVELALANILYLFNWELPNGMARKDVDTHGSIGIIVRKKNPLCLLAKSYL